MAAFEALQRCLDQLGSVLGSASPHAKLVEEAGQALASAVAEHQALAAKLSVYEDAAGARNRSGQDWQALLANRESEVVRLRAEIGRMRSALASTNQAHAGQADEVTALQAQLQQAAHLNMVQQRQSVVATAAADTQVGELHRLRAELDARTAQLSRLEADMAAQQAAASARLTEMQDSFIAKIADLRRGHQEQIEQMAAAARSASAGPSNQQAVESAAAAAAATAAAAQAEVASLRHRLKAAEDDAAALRQRQAQQQQASPSPAAASASPQAQHELQAQLAAAKAEADAAKSALSSLQFGEKALKARLKELEAALAAAQRQAQQQQSGAAVAAAAAPQANGQSSGGPGMDLGMLGMMEGQLARLSEIIRTREAEVAQMRAALQAGLEERKDLIAQIEALQGQLAHLAQQHAGGGGGSGLPSPKSASGGAGGGAVRVGVAVSPSRPYRTGLTSKPKFK